MIICITGMPGSGKTELAHMLAGKGFKVIEMGDLLRQAVQKAGLDPIEKNVGAYATKHRQETGRTEIFAVEAVPLIEKMHGKDIVIAGARSEKEIEYFKKALKHMFTIAIVASPEVRFRRLSARGRSDDHVSLANFNARDERERGYGIESVIADADYIIFADAERGVLEMNDEINAIIAEIREIEKGSKK